jgi:hypothetical protein
VGLFATKDGVELYSIGHPQAAVSNTDIPANGPPPDTSMN